MFDIECAEDLPSNWREVAAKGGPAPWWQPGTRRAAAAPSKEWIKGMPNTALLVLGGGLALAMMMGGRR